MEYLRCKCTQALQWGRCARTGHPLKLPSQTKLARLSHFPPASQAGRHAGPVFYVYVFSLLPPFGPIGRQKWFFQISSQWESQKNRFAFISFSKIYFLHPCVWDFPFMSYRIRCCGCGFAESGIQLFNKSGSVPSPQGLMTRNRQNFHFSGELMENLFMKDITNSSL